MSNTTSTFMEKVRSMWEAQRFLCAGFDSDVDRIPKWVAKASLSRYGQFDFNQGLLNATQDVAGFIKPNDAFYAGVPDFEGDRALADTFAHIRDFAPQLVSIYDAKRGDIGATNVGYVKKLLLLGADAITVSPYFELEAMKPFLDSDNGIIVLCRTSNPGAEILQDRLTLLTPEEAEMWGYKSGERESEVVTFRSDRRFMIPFYQLVAHRVSTYWNYNGNCALVVGATVPDQLRAVRSIVGDGFLMLMPGLGKQQAKIEEAIAAGMDSNGEGFTINNSSQLDFAYEENDELGDEGFVEAARVVALQNHRDILSARESAMAARAA